MKSAILAGLLVVRVPFDFQAGDTHLAPGEYVVAMDKAATVSVTLENSERAQRAEVAVGAEHDANGHTTASVSFRAYGESRFLSAIQVEGKQWDIAPSADETALTRTHGPAKVTTLRAENSDKK